MTFEEKWHIGNDVLEMYSLRHLSDAEHERVENHLLICEQCQEELVRVEAFISDMKAACRLQQKMEASARESRLSRWFHLVPRPAMAAACATVLLAIGIPWVMQDRSPVGAPFAVQLAVMRGPEAAAKATAERDRPLQLRISSAELPAAGAYRVEVVDSVGARVWSGEPRAESGHLVADVNRKLPAGSYWVRLFTTGGDPVREFGLVVQ